MTRYATIIGTGRYLPPIERSNDQMRAQFGEVIDKFETATSIQRRFYAPDDWATSVSGCRSSQGRAERRRNHA